MAYGRVLREDYSCTVLPFWVNMWQGCLFHPRAALSCICLYCTPEASCGALMQMGATAGLFFMQASGTVLNALGYNTELGVVSRNGVNYLDLTEAWHKGTTDVVVPPEKKVYQKHTPNR